MRVRLVLYVVAVLAGGGCRIEQGAWRGAATVDPTDYDADLPAMGTAFARGAGYWANAMPALVRLSRVRAEHGLDATTAFEGIAPAFRGSAAEWGELLEETRLKVEELDAVREISGNLAPRAAELRGEIGQAVVERFDAQRLAALAPLVMRSGTVPANELDDLPLTPAPKRSLQPQSEKTNPDDTDTSKKVAWDKIDSPTRWKTTYNASCVAQAAGPCAAKLGILNKEATCRDWNDLSKELGATANGEGGGYTSSVYDYFKKHGYCGSRATDALFGFGDSACEEAKAALGRGCDVLVRYSSWTEGHYEMVTRVRLKADTSACTLETLSWGSAATCHYCDAAFKEKSDGKEYSDGNKSYLESGASARMYYFCKC